MLAALGLFATQGCSRSREEAQARQVAERVKTEFLHAWNNYERYAWGHDALRPLSKTAHDWYGQSLQMTPVDALDTLILMKLEAEAAKAQALIVSDLSFDRDIYVKNFEITIRLLGGLLSSYQLTGDKRLLGLAEDLGTRLLPAFNSPTGLPLRLCQSSHRTGSRSGVEPGGNRHAAPRVRHPQQTDRQARLLRQGETGPGRNLQASFAARSGRHGH